MLGIVAFALVVLVLTVLSIRERMRLRFYREKDWSSFGEALPSPLAQALANLVGVAGGIYLSLVMLTSFLDLRVPERVEIGHLSLEPLATVSFALALLQPFLNRVIIAWRKV